MILYFAEEGSDNVPREEQAHVLKSFAYKREALSVLNEKRKTFFFLDSGAFTSFSLGKTVDIKSYAHFIKEHEANITVASNLDAIKDYKQTLANQRILESLGCNVLPVFHYGEPWDLLRQYSKEYNYIAFGGLVPIARFRKKMQEFLDVAFSITQDKVLVHGFGVNSVWAWKRYPFYSVDATSWLMGPRMRIVYRWNGDRMLSVNKTSGEKNIERLKAHTSHYHELARLNLQAYRQGAEYVTNLWKMRGICYPAHHGSIKK